MKLSQFIDTLQLKINSILFRLVVILYSAVILYINNNYFNLIIYIAGIIIYFITYIYLLKHSKLRLLNDFLFITFILADKNPDDIINFVFLVLPIINSINFSGQKKSFLLYFLSLSIYLLIVCFYNEKCDLANIYSCKSPFIPIIFLWLINSYTSLRSKIRTFRENLNDIVDNFYLEKEAIIRPHKIYKKLIEEINQNIKSELVEGLICFIIVKGKKEKLVLVNSSSFIWYYEFENENFIKNLRDKKSLINEVISIEKENKKFNLSMFIKVENQEYVFLFTTKKTIPIYYIIIGFDRMFVPALSKISKFLLSEKKLQELKNEEITKLSEQRQYVNRANKTMHFMRNRLGPFSNLLKMLDTLDTVPQEKESEFKKLLSAEKERAGTELKNITERANDMLEKSNNPFGYSVIKDISLEKIFTILKRNFSSFFPDLELIVKSTPTGNRKYVKINEEGFELFLSDWLNNMKKYKKNFVSCEFFLDRETLMIVFCNDHNLIEEDVRKMISDITSDDRNEIMKRTTHGLFSIKTTLEEMCIPFEMKNYDEFKRIEFKLKLKTFENENSNI